MYNNVKERAVVAVAVDFCALVDEDHTVVTFVRHNRVRAEATRNDRRNITKASRVRLRNVLTELQKLTPTIVVPKFCEHSLQLYVCVARTTAYP